jgi:dihydroorotate dehydrogenase electron transfer subunit
MKKELFTKIIANDCIAKDTYKLILKVPADLCFVSGQFANIKINRADLLLRRPISIYRYEKDEMTFIYKVVGKGTKELSDMKVSENLSILASLGKGFEILPAYKNVFLVGGGIGCAPLMSIIESNEEINYTTFLGFDTADSIYCESEFEAKSKKLLISTDDGSYGYNGFITQLLSEKLDEGTPDVIFACGPTPMLKSLQTVLKSKNIKAFISIEERMGCGMGGCAVCACMTTNGVKKACVDGPVFNLNEVVL